MRAADHGTRERQQWEKYRPRSGDDPRRASRARRESSSQQSSQPPAGQASDSTRSGESRLHRLTRSERYAAAPAPRRVRFERTAYRARNDQTRARAAPANFGGSALGATLKHGYRVGTQHAAAVPPLHLVHCAACCCSEQARATLARAFSNHRRRALRFQQRHRLPARMAETVKADHVATRPRRAFRLRSECCARFACSRTRRCSLWTAHNASSAGAPHCKQSRAARRAALCAFWSKRFGALIGTTTAGRQAPG